MFRYIYFFNYIFISLVGASYGLIARFLGFSLYVSNTTHISDGVLCFKDTNFTTLTLYDGFLNINCPVHGQYVIYYNERLAGVTYPTDYSIYAYSELCEVEVFGMDCFLYVLICLL